LFAPGGLKLPDEVERRIEREIDSLPAPVGEPGQLHTEPDSTAYSDHILGAIEGRSLSGLRIVVDCANGAASTLAPRVLMATGATVYTINDAPDGRNINDRCGATHTESLVAAVQARHADIGLALDGDADRLLAVDHTGQVVDGDHVLAICALDLAARGELHDNTVVATVMSNLGFRLAMEAAGIDVVETAVGDRYVLEAIDASGYSLGGEQSGHVIFRDRATTGDGLLTGVILADIVTRQGQPLADLAAAAMTRLPQVLVNVTVAERVADPAQHLAADIAAAEVALAGSGRVLVRSSGTEPLVRVMVEAADHEVARRVAGALADAAATRWGGHATA
jgi:phosphoglucosamine mutase